MPKVEKYGVEWQPVMHGGKIHVPWTEWQIERNMFMWGKEKATAGAKFPKQHLGEAEHFRRMVSIVLGRQGCRNYFEWNPNAVRIVDEYFKNRFLAIAGHGSSGKTKTIAVIAVFEFIASPNNTAVLVTSTTINDSRKRVWGDIENYWNEACDFFGDEDNMPGKLLSASAVIRAKVIRGSKTTNDTTKGIMLIPGGESQVTDGIGRMKGFKAERMIFLGDELADLSHKLVEAAESNLVLNEVGTGKFKFVGTFNPTSHFGPDGILSEPKNGWGSLDVLNSDGWETKRGYCIRFDGERSPNVLLGEAKWKGLLTRELLEEQRQKLGDNSFQFMQQYRGAWSETGSSDAIYTEAEIIKYLGMKKVEVWQDKPKLCAGFDPSHTHGGDRAVLVVAKAGVGLGYEKFLPLIEFQETIYLDDNLDTSQDKNELIISRLKREMQERGIDARFLAMDATGGGNPLATLMARDPFFSNSFLRVQFGGAASDLMSQGKRGKDRYANMASELWYAGKPLLREGQIRGLRPEMVREMTLRLYEETGGSLPKIRIESKEDMKKRLNGRSPDCFVAGTMISTPSGDKPIESLEIGDEVLTPFGSSIIIATHLSNTNETTKVAISNGSVLEGKGSHKVMQNGKWVPMRDLLLTNKIESVINRDLWIILNQLFTTAKDTEFKHLVDTSNPAIKKMRRDYFIEPYGRSTMGLFLVACVSIIKMAIGEITQSRILNLCQYQSTQECTVGLTGKIRNLFQGFKKGLKRLSKKLLNGIPAKKGLLGIKNMVGAHGKDERKTKSANVKIVTLNSSHSEADQIFAQQDAGRHFITKSDFAQKLRVMFAAMNSLLTNITKRNLVVESVEQFSWCDPVKTYNLTLLNDNAYYANGVLVDNCSDAMFLSLFSARARLGLATQEKTAKAEKKPEGPLDHLFQWGLRKKPQFDKPEYVMKGGGWGDEGYDFDAMMNR